MEVVGCPPFCEVGCSLVHDKLLLALVSCPEGEISTEHSSRLSSVIENKWKDGWCSQDPVDDPNPDFRYPAVLWACAIGKPVLVKWLLSNGFVQDTQDKDSGDNGLHRSILCLQKSLRNWKEAICVFKELLPLMPDCLMMKNSAGYTPLHLACEMFLDKESSMDFYRDCALAIFEYAQMKGLEFVSKLLNSQKEDGQTVLHTLAHSDHTFKVLRAFVTQGKPDMWISDNQGMTALGVAVTSAQMKSSQLLSKHQTTRISPVETVDQSTTDNSKECPDNVEYTKIKEESVYCDDTYTVQNNNNTESSSEKVKLPNNIAEMTFKTSTSENNNATEVSSKIVKSQNSTTKVPSKTVKSQAKTKEQPSESVKSENSSQRRSPRRAVKRKVDEKLDAEAEAVQEKDRSPKVLQTITDNDMSCTKNLRKRCKTDLDKDRNDTGDNVTMAEKNTENKALTVDQTVEDLKRRKTKSRSPRNSPVSSGRKKLRLADGDAKSCPVLSSVIDEQRIEVTGKTPPTLSPQVDKDTCILEKIKSKEIWSRYIEFCGKSLPESVPVLLEMSTTQLQDVFAVCPDVREKLGDYLELLSVQERLMVSPTVQDLIALDPLEEKLKDSIATEVEKNEEREMKMKKDVMELVSFEDRVKSPYYETESPFNNGPKDSDPKVKNSKVYNDSNENEGCDISLCSNKKKEPSGGTDFEMIKGEKSDKLNENSPTNNEISALKEKVTEEDKIKTMSLRDKSGTVIDNTPTDNDMNVLKKMKKIVMQIDMDKTRSLRDKNDIVSDSSPTTDEISALKEEENVNTQKEINETKVVNLDNRCQEEIVNDKMSEASTDIPDNVEQETTIMEEEIGDLKMGNEDIVKNKADLGENLEVHHETNCVDEQSSIKDDGDADCSTVLDISTNETVVIEGGNRDAAIEMENEGTIENVSQKLRNADRISPKLSSDPGIGPEIIVTNGQKGPSENADRTSTETSPGKSTYANGLVAYLSYNSSTKALLRESLYRDRDECLEIWQKKQDILNSLNEKHKQLESCNNELEAEINSYMEKINELKTRLSHNKTQELELQSEIQSERIKIEQVKVKVQTCEKALEELNQ